MMGGLTLDGTKNLEEKLPGKNVGTGIFFQRTGCTIEEVPHMFYGLMMDFMLIYIVLYDIDIYLPTLSS